MGNSLACIDLVGTAVADHGLVEAAYAEALATVAIAPRTTAFDRAMALARDDAGLPAETVFATLFPGNDGLTAAALMSYRRALESALDRFGVRPMPGAEAALDKLRGAGVQICILTSQTSRVTARILDALDWWHRVDFTLCLEDSRRPLPHPDPLLTAALRAPLDDLGSLIVCTATWPAAEAARRARTPLIAALRTAPQPRSRLESAGATHFIDSLADLPALIMDAHPATPR